MLTLLLLKQGERRGVLDGLAEGHHMALLLINGELEIGDGTGGGHGLRDGTSILLLFPTHLCGGFLFQFFW
jgi:hypothetical protein